MTNLKHSKGTDTEHTVKLDSTLVSSTWQSGMAIGGKKARFRVQTAFVGNGADVEVKGQSVNGKKLGKVKGKIIGNFFVGSLKIPEDIEEGDEIYYTVKLSKNGLSGESEKIPAFPPPRVKSMKWSADEARRGDIMTLSGEFEDIPDNSEVVVTIYEYDENDANDKITEFPATLNGKKLEAKWAYQYFEDTDEIPTQQEKERYGSSYNPPEYFFTVKYGNFEMGKEQESGLLNFKDYIEINLTDEAGNPVPNEDYVLHLPDGTEKQGTLDDNGYAKEEGIPPGSTMVEFPNLEEVDSDDNDEEDV